MSSVPRPRVPRSLDFESGSTGQAWRDGLCFKLETACLLHSWFLVLDGVLGLVASHCLLGEPGLWRGPGEGTGLCSGWAGYAWRP